MLPLRMLPILVVAVLVNEGASVSLSRFPITTAQPTTTESILPPPPSLPPETYAELHFQLDTEKWTQNVFTNFSRHWTEWPKFRDGFQRLLFDNVTNNDTCGKYCHWDDPELPAQYNISKFRQIWNHYMAFVDETGIRDLPFHELENSPKFYVQTLLLREIFCVSITYHNTNVTFYEAPITVCKPRTDRNAPRRRGCVDFQFYDRKPFR